MPFGITPLAGFAQQAPTEFPQFLQWQQDGTDLGDNAVQVVNIATGLTATRGTGESINTVTLEAIPDTGIGILASSVSLGDAHSLNFASDLVVSIVGTEAEISTAGVGVLDASVLLGNAKSLNFTGGLGVSLVGTEAEITAGLLAWRVVPGDDVIETSDYGNGLWCDGTTGAQQITVSSIPAGRSVLIVQAGAAPVDLVPASGITLLYRTAAFLAATAGQGAILTLIAGPDGNTVIVCGDMAAA